MIDLVKARALCAAATPGPWRYVQILDGIEARALVDDKGYHFGRCDDLENGAFTAAARTGWPEALDAFEIALKIIEEYKVSNLQIEIRANRDIAALKAEVEILHQNTDTLKTMQQTEREGLMAENARLRKALRAAIPYVSATAINAEMWAALAAPQTGGDDDT